LPTGAVRAVLYIDISKKMYGEALETQVDCSEIVSDVDGGADGDGILPDDDLGPCCPSGFTAVGSRVDSDQTHVVCLED
jgi:hypothetical protein